MGASIPLLTIGASSYGYTVAANSNRLSATAGPAPAQTNTYDASGNLTGNGTYTLAYSDRGRLKSATLAAGTVSYVYNALEQRVRKSGPTSLVATGAVLYVYDEAGRLLGDYNNSLRVLRETVYLGEMPIVVLGQTVAGSPANYTTQVYHVYCDQIGTPRVITQATTNKMRWRWDSAEPFGTTAAQENPAAVGVFGYDPRFAGQMRDKETGLHYNWHRDYDALVGRYTQSDPIGLAGGINTYAYVEGNPLSYVDPDGLQKGPPARNTYYPRGTMPRPITFPRPDNSSQAAGYFNPDGSWTCLQWSCPSSPNSCGAGDLKSYSDFIPQATDPASPPAGCKCAGGPDWKRDWGLPRPYGPGPVDAARDLADLYNTLRPILKRP